MTTQKFLLIGAALLYSVLCNAQPVAKGPQTPEALFKEIIQKLEANDIKGVEKNFIPTKQNKEALHNMKPVGKARFISGLKRAKLSKKTNDTTLIYNIPYYDKKTSMDIPMTVIKMPSGYWIVSSW